MFYDEVKNSMRYLNQDLMRRLNSGSALSTLWYHQNDCTTLHNSYAELISGKLLFGYLPLDIMAYLFAMRVMLLSITHSTRKPQQVEREKDSHAASKGYSSANIMT